MHVTVSSCQLLTVDKFWIVAYVSVVSNILTNLHDMKCNLWNLDY